MALSAGRGQNSTLLPVPSMHSDLFDDPVTTDLLDALQKEGSHVILNKVDEGKLKQPDVVSIVADVCHIVNSTLIEKSSDYIGGQQSSY